MKNELIRLQNVWCKGNGTAQLCGVDLCVFPGETLSIGGGHDSGKSIIFDILEGRRIPDKGSLFLRGERENFGSSLVRALRVQRISEDTHLIESLSVIENIMLLESNAGHTVFKHKKREANEIIQFFDRFGIKLNLFAHSSALSNYERFLIFLLCARLKNAEIILVDYSFLDCSSMEMQIIGLALKRINELGISVLFATMDSAQTRFFASRQYQLYLGIANKAEYILTPKDGAGLSILPFTSFSEYPISKPESLKKIERFHGKLQFSKTLTLELDFSSGEYIAIVDSYKRLQGANENWSENLRFNCMQVGENLCRELSSKEIAVVDFSTIDEMPAGLSPVDSLCVGIEKKLASCAIIPNRFKTYLKGSFSNWYGDEHVMMAESCAELTYLERLAIALYKIVLIKPRILLFTNVGNTTDDDCRRLIQRTIQGLYSSGTVLFSLITTDHFSDFAEKYTLIEQNRIFYNRSYLEAWAILGEHSMEGNHT